MLNYTENFKIDIIKLPLIIFLFSLFIEASSDRSIYLKDYGTENKVALVIGNSNYTNFSILKNPVNDAKDIRKVLKAKGFDVLFLENGDLRSMKKIVRKFSHKLKNGGVGLFYYAGHGLEVNGKNYLIPIKAEIPEEDEVEYESLAVNMIIDKMKYSHNRLNIIILDACRSNPFGRDGSGGLAQINNAKGMYIAFATAPGKVASDGGSGENGLFTKHLIQNINEPNLNLNGVFRKTREGVHEESDGKQLPWTSSSMIGDFYFPLAQALNTQSSTSDTTTEMKTAERADLERLRRLEEERKEEAQGEELAHLKAEIVRLKEDKKLQLEWIDPSESMCKKYGGKVYDGICQASWETAKKICRASNGRLPTLDRLKKEILRCGGTVEPNNRQTWNSNSSSLSYQSCYKVNGFSADSYWSSSIEADEMCSRWLMYGAIDEDRAWSVEFYNGSHYDGIISLNINVRCIKSESIDEGKKVNTDRNKPETKCSTYFVTTIELNVRDKPEYPSNILGTVKEDDSVCVRHFSGRWAKIDSGWISGNHISLQKNSHLDKDIKLIDTYYNKTDQFSTYELSGNSEVCKMKVLNKNKIVSKTCISLTNSKGIKILCTPRKRICKTNKEFFDFVKGERKDLAFSRELKWDAKKYVALGDNYYFGRGIFKDYIKAREYYLKACDMGSGGGCHNLATVYENEEGVTKNHSMALKYYKKACELGVEKSCKHYTDTKKMGFFAQ